MLKKLFTLGLAIVSIAVLSSCGGDERQPLDAESANLVLATFATQVLGKLPTSDTLPTLPIPGVTATASTGLEAMATGCETVTPAVRVDNDSDGIAAEKTYTYNCSDLPDTNGMLRTYQGRVTIRDLDDTVPGVYGGVRADYDVPVYKNVDNGTEYNYQHIGYWHYYAEGNTLISKSEYQGKNSYSYPDGLINDYTYTYTWDFRYTPDNPGDRWNTGQIDIEGSFKLKGLFINEDAQGNHFQGEGSFFVNYRGVGLKRQAGCTKYYSEGTYIIEDGNGTTIEIKYSCTSAKLYVNGAESDWWTP